MSRYFARGVQIAIDMAVLSLAYWLAFLLRFEFAPGVQYTKLLFFTWPYVVVLQYLVLSLFGVPSLSWRYVNIKDTTRILWAVAICTAVLVGLRLGLAPLRGYFRFVSIPLGVLGMNLVLAFLGVAGVRVLRRVLAERRERGRVARKLDRVEKRTLLIGAGSAGVQVAREVAQNPGIGMRVVGFVDDNPMKIGTVIQGHKVLGDSGSLAALVDEYKADEAVITIASASGKAIRGIVESCKEIELPVRIIPGLSEILDGRVNLSRIRPVEIEDLLGREAVELDLEALGRFITGKRVLVTGAGGSIGSELCRQVGRFQPERLVLLEQSENVLFEIHGELSREQPELDTVPCIADVCDAERVERVFSRHSPEVIFHAAAHKHVPMMEWNPGEAIKNNVFGTKMMADAADRHGSEAFVLISTDKAVNPTSIMGASKRVAEIYTQSLSTRSKTSFVAVRFGNVLGSAGSVIPIFKKQIKAGGPVTVTHPEMKRYFMTIPEACQLVMEAASLGHGGEIFVLDMGEPVKIVDLARDLIRLSGFTGGEISVEFTGIRPGEKLFEELSTAGEEMDKTRHPKIFIGHIEPVEHDAVAGGLDALRRVAETGAHAQIRAVLGDVVPEMGEPAGDEEKISPVAPPARAETIH